MVIDNILVAPFVLWSYNKLPYQCLGEGSPTEMEGHGDTTRICAGTVAGEFIDYVSNFIIILHPILD